MSDHLLTILHHLPSAALLVNGKGVILRVNQAAEQLFGYGAGCLDNQSLDLLVPKDRRELHAELLYDFYKNPSVCPRGTGLPRHGLRQDGSLVPVDIALAPVHWGEEVLFLATLYDLSLHKQTELELRQVNRSLRFLSKVNRVVAHVRDELTLLQEVCQAAVEAGNYRMAWVGVAEHDGDRKIRPVAFHGFNNGFIEKLNITWGETGNNLTAMGEAIRSGQPIVRNNILGDPQMSPCRADAKQRGYQSVIALPLKVQDTVWGALALFAPEHAAFTPQECKVLTELAEDLCYGIRACSQVSVQG